ncbi:MAG: sulfoxide reductase heme-binding subunit YedZ [Methyloversatilis sp.]|uniref:sulfite oxidase heme-binding subunit YedZ n=1 Tax=Methyloversatilis sp. TaxID=2569862 RepID=UPI0025CF4FCB|nr:protein-methionine-sulfoxide reductase heme-binding subunit MsrQ [Methyloversatilis sp.]MCR6668334.1 sulfoxide reductase heme-binding subunit YedZ [Methyloversatilis sp.]
MRERAFSPDRVQLAWIWRAVWAACLLPLMLLVAGGLRDALGANPIEHITRATGDWTLRLLLLTLAVTPLRQLTGWHWLVRLRRTLGLYAFFYGSLHLATYVWLDQFFDWPGIVADIVKRPFVTLGFAAFVLMLPLAITSTNGMIRRLGGRSWQRLHRAVYAVGVLGVAHYWWLVKKDLTEPITYAFVLATLFALRLWHGRRMRRTLEAQAA